MEKLVIRIENSSEPKLEFSFSDNKVKINLKDPKEETMVELFDISINFAKKYVKSYNDKNVLINLKNSNKIEIKDIVEIQIEEQNENIEFQIGLEISKMFIKEFKLILFDEIENLSNLTE